MEGKLNNGRVQAGYLPTLDGWRAIAILAVIFYHDDLHRIGPFSTRWLYQYGFMGVDIFFAISGILICTRLLEEEERFGRISLRTFYIRRAFRIFPAALCYLAVTGLLGLFGLIVVYKRELLASLLFCRNYSFLLGPIGPLPADFTGHYWSLAVEEHFYLLLPALLVLTPKRWRIPVLLSLAAIVLANCAWQLRTRPWDLIEKHTDTRLVALLLPAALAVAIKTPFGRKHIGRLLRHWRWLALLTLAVISMMDQSSSRVFWQITALACLFPCVVMGSVLHPQNLIGRFLELAPMRYIGRISYGLYLWQELFFTAHFYPIRPLGLLQKWPLNWAAVFGSTMLSYYLLEKPMLRLGHRLARPASQMRTEP